MDAGGDGLRDALGEINLGAYADLLVVEFGYILDDIKDMDAEELKAVAADAEMRRGEELRFLKRFGQPQAKKESIVVRLVNAGYSRQLACRAMVDLKIPPIEFTPEQESQAVLFIEQALGEQASPTSNTAPVMQPAAAEPPPPPPPPARESDDASCGANAPSSSSASRASSTS
mmetsp:Transcript_15539/g.50608  ORF Transcript_15539/g.50608 Transcript_15539/m.50608 type:complete len:173 (-) Transcript_15539:715-1233(-)